MTNVAASWTTTVPAATGQNAALSTSIAQTASPAILNAGQAALAQEGLALNSVAYVMAVTKIGVSGTGAATVSMEVPASWVKSNGGVSSIAIIHTADDGITQILNAQLTGTDPKTGYLIFTATSPKGLSTFTLVSVNQSAVAANQTTNQTNQTVALTMAGTPLQTSVVTTPVQTSMAGTPVQAIPAVTTGVKTTKTRTPLPVMVTVGALGVALVVGARRRNN
jgi:hypothetical protein